MKKCKFCGKNFKPQIVEQNVCEQCGEDLERDAAREMGCEDYYDATGELPGDK
tara:strand:- start:604 stop:762 length:159 start_codon:yes stop_codon:yes gene_type:complete